MLRRALAPAPTVKPSYEAAADAGWTVLRRIRRAPCVTGRRRTASACVKFGRRVTFLVRIMAGMVNIAATITAYLVCRDVRRRLDQAPAD